MYYFLCAATIGMALLHLVVYFYIGYNLEKLPLGRGFGLEHVLTVLVPFSIYVLGTLAALTYIVKKHQNLARQVSNLNHSLDRIYRNQANVPRSDPAST